MRAPAKYCIICRFALEAQKMYRVLSLNCRRKAIQNGGLGPDGGAGASLVPPPPRSATGWTLIFTFTNLSLKIQTAVNMASSVKGQSLVKIKVRTCTCLFSAQSMVAAQGLVTKGVCVVLSGIWIQLHCAGKSLLLWIYWWSRSLETTLTVSKAPVLIITVDFYSIQEYCLKTCIFEINEKG